MTEKTVIPIPYMTKSSRSDRVCLSCGLNISDQYGYMAYKHSDFCPSCGMPAVILWNNDAPPRCKKCGKPIIESAVAFVGLPSGSEYCENCFFGEEKDG